MKFLVVEDDYITAQVMIEILSGLGKTDWAEDGNKGLELFINNSKSDVPYTCVFLDIMLPEKNGQEVLYAIREFETQQGLAGLDTTSIIMTTALDDFENIKKAFLHQCEGYLVKPIQKDNLIKALANINIL